MLRPSKYEEDGIQFFDFEVNYTPGPPRGLDHYLKNVRVVRSISANDPTEREQTAAEDQAEDEMQEPDGYASKG